MELVATNISVRVPWHDAQWNGTVCHDPAANCFCVEYQNIAKYKNVAYEVSVKDKHFFELDPVNALPACADESGGFLSPQPWTISHEHPYRHNPKVTETHGHLKRTSWTVEPWTAHAVPFHWLRGQYVQEWVQPKVLAPLPPDDEPPDGFKTNWVFGPALQGAILDGFWSPVVDGESLAFFYTKSSHPIADDIPRLVVGIGDITHVSRPRYYDSMDTTKRRHPIWQRDVQHSLRPKGVGGLLVPFHDYLADAGDPEENQRRLELAQRLVIAPEADRILEFSYRSEHISPDSTVFVLTQAIAVVHHLREDKIAAGNWEAAESWLNSRLSRAWQLRGPNPGLGPVLEAMGLRMGTSIIHLMAQLNPRFGDDPWAAVSPVLEGTVAPPDPRFSADVIAFRPLWRHYLNDPAKMQLARSLSLIALDTRQAKRWWDADIRKRATTVPINDAVIIENPYVLSEVDKGEPKSRPVSFSTVDRAVLAGHGAVGMVSPSDRRRRRAAVVSILRRAAADGDTLLGVPELKDKVVQLAVPEPVDLPDVWLSAEAGFVAERLKVTDGQPRTVQLSARAAIAGSLQRKLGARATRAVDVPRERWTDLLEATVRASTGAQFDPNESRAAAALVEQATALDIILGRKLTVLTGRAGTGKTTVLGALSRAPSLSGKVLFLAPTGKARVRLEARVASGTEVMTVAQYLHINKRYDGPRQQPIIGDPCYDAHETIVIDESSMLTEDDLAAVLATFTPAVRRFILVGDPAQLPPIGPGRPFADLVAHLDPLEIRDDEDLDNLKLRRGAIARLFQEVRSIEGGGRSDTLRLASWFTDDPAPPDAERIFAEIADPTAVLNDLSTARSAGVSDARELKRAAEHDPVVASHYAGFDYVNARIVRLVLARSAYVSYRVGNWVHWMRHRVRLMKGEKLITDGRITVRARCGNRVEEVPQQATSLTEPSAAKLDEPIRPSTGTAVTGPPVLFQSGLAESQQAPARSYFCSPRKAGVSSSRSTSLSKILRSAMAC